MDSQSIEHEEQSAWNQLEFALNFLHPCSARIERLKSQLESKLLAAHGEIQYTIGLDSKGESIGLSNASLDLAISNMRLIAEEVKANLQLLSKQSMGNGTVAQVLIRKSQLQTYIIDIRVALIGESQSGKSSFIGVVSKGVKENGRGSARNAILRHMHEKKQGFTASVTQHLVGFDCRGKIIKHNKSWAELVMKSSKLISFIDLPGNKKYRSTLFYGLISQCPEYFILMIDPSNMNPSNNTEYLSMITALNIPFMIILSKCDKATSSKVDGTLDYLRGELCKREKILLEVLSPEDVVLYSRTFLQENIVPVFSISLKTSLNKDLVISFLNLLPSRNNYEECSSTEFYLEKWYTRESMVILCGIMIKGKARLGEKLLLGPDLSGKFIPVIVLGIHVKEISVHSVTAGQFCSFQVNKVQELRRGMVLVDVTSNPMPSLEFECLVWTIDDSINTRIIKSSYKPLVYTQTITQCVAIVSGPEQVNPHEIMKFKFHFLYHPEYITIGTKLMIRDTFMTALGTIITVRRIDPP
ncbi:hypothetical protein SteCoe_12025 [Stentor coeruleus]|uniref:Tr-type G domain-containing protein n=1 Tax=Stentor coeruleus TaxID=5963 RepID=A0A1R2CBU1_9CILI|nr:hypothetical protein SteCoe_12025 [Stentor coeruleus]